MRENRRYERYAIDNSRNERVEVKIIVDGVSVSLMDFSLGGLYFLSEKPFSEGELVNLSINLEDKGKMDLMGRVVRSIRGSNNESWGTVIDLSQTYNLKSIHKV